VRVVFLVYYVYCRFDLASQSMKKGENACGQQTLLSDGSKTASSRLRLTGKRIAALDFGRYNGWACSSSPGSLHFVTVIACSITLANARACMDTMEQ
jgi:hypothetical protein